MYVTTIGAVGDSKLIKKKAAKAGGSGFSELISSGDAEEASPAGTASVSSASQLFFLQEVDNEDQHKKEAVSQGFDALKYLDNIRNGLLLGTLSRGTIMGLDSLLQKFKKNFSDPHLTQVIEEIELRARVEIAKLERDQ